MRRWPAIATGVACAAFAVLAAASCAPTREGAATRTAGDGAAETTDAPRSVRAAPPGAIATTTTTTTKATTDATIEPTTQATTEATTEAAPPRAPDWVALSPKIRVARAEGLVEFDAVAVLKEGFLEEFVCTASTREHESLFVFDGKASEVHAALLVAGLVPGAPGGWREPTDEREAADAGFVALAPHGPEVTVEVVLPDGSCHEIASFARLSPVAFGAEGGDGRAAPAPPSRFVFAGSRFRARPDGGERYLADDSGSLIGLVTFGDETIAPLDVIPDQASVSAPIFEADPARMPAPGTAVVIRVRAPRPAEVGR
ncbi:MAG: hypothetical protein RI967_2156 [Planctomycetota bacterium]